MTAPTPEQMRTRADDMDSKGHHWSGQPAHDFFEAATALRAAADQLEAVRAWAFEHGGHFTEISELEAILKGSIND